jgi:hypothetical protein
MSPTAATCTSASHPAVSKQWIFRFTIAGGTRDAGLGPYPTVSLVKAREEAEKYRRLVATGIDPIQARNEERASARAAAEGRSVLVGRNSILRIACGLCRRSA